MFTFCTELWIAISERNTGPNFQIDDSCLNDHDAFRHFGVFRYFISKNSISYFLHDCRRKLALEWENTIGHRCTVPETKVCLPNWEADRKRSLTNRYLSFSMRQSTLSYAVISGYRIKGHFATSVFTHSEQGIFCRLLTT